MAIDRRRFIAAAVLGAGASAMRSGRALAQPGGKVTRIVVGFPAGGAVDVVARLYAEQLQSALGGSVIVENKTGAGGRIGTEAARGAAPNGETLLLSPSSILTIYPHVYRKLGFDVFRDFMPVSPACDFVFGLGVGPGTPAASPPAFVQWARENPKAASFGSPGAGTTPHFIGVAFAGATGAPLVHVPYKGGAQAMQDLLGGQLAAMVTTLPNLVPQYRGGKLRILAHTAEARLPELPDVPTFKELGYPDLVLSEWFGFFVPTGTPQETVAKLNTAIVAAGASAAVREGLSKLGFRTLTRDPVAFGAMVRADFDRWGPIVKASGFKADE